MSSNAINTNSLTAGAGKFVSESKFIQDPAAFINHIRSRDREALEALITKPEVEAKLLTRLQKKVDTYSPDIAADDDSPNSKELKKPNGGKIDTDGVLDLYESYIIPLTKEVEVRNSHVLALRV